MKKIFLSAVLLAIAALNLAVSSTDKSNETNLDINNIEMLAEGDGILAYLFGSYWKETNRYGTYDGTVFEYECKLGGDKEECSYGEHKTVETCPYYDYSEVFENSWYYGKVTVSQDYHFWY